MNEAMADRLSKLEDWIYSTAANGNSVNLTSTDAKWLIRLAMNNTQASSDPVKVVHKDDGVDGSPILGYITEADLPLTEAFISGYNRRNDGQMSGDLVIIELEPFNPENLD